MNWTQLGFEQGTWLNPPERQETSPDRLAFDVTRGTDFWRQTHYGFTRASGHALLMDVPRLFAAEITFGGAFTGKYEQAGFLLWVDESQWIKFGIEFADGLPNLAAVVTRGASDWSMAPAPDVDRLRIRLTVTPTAAILHAKVAQGWQILRVADFTFDTARLGPMACAPETGGLSVVFEDFRIGPVPEEPLYING
ncbi:hypothetical protein CLV78_104350 [Aliiruegeria haliotis]|uniref:DUF1349 domain-containing protein n=1 Tax=Aliiruegeria haliotis TaxID=1280846 RepID=A0A2T0RRV9_9RHOB|nr:DUF1349 domain-containing protein [Aliiruegeria haliotis]PRY23857.1 hypothetical protein CLV78_104350 [Aliiruegeria haliotis]